MPHTTKNGQNLRRYKPSATTRKKKRLSPVYEVSPVKVGRFTVYVLNNKNKK